MAKATVTSATVPQAPAKPYRGSVAASNYTTPQPKPLGETKTKLTRTTPLQVPLTPSRSLQYSQFSQQDDGNTPDDTYNDCLRSKEKRAKRKSPMKSTNAAFPIPDPLEHLDFEALDNLDKPVSRITMTRFRALKVTEVTTSQERQQALADECSKVVVCVRDNVFPSSSELNKNKTHTHTITLQGYWFHSDIAKGGVFNVFSPSGKYKTDRR